MTASTRIERSGPAIRAALEEHSPSECESFEAEFAAAIAVAGHTFDLVPLEALLDRWWGIAVMRAHPLTDAEREIVERARRGDFTGLIARDEHGHRIRL